MLNQSILSNKKSIFYHFVLSLFNETFTSNLWISVSFLFLFADRINRQNIAKKSRIIVHEEFYIRLQNCYSNFKKKKINKYTYT